MTQTLQNTINFALPFIQYSPLTAGLGQEPAVSIASMIRTSLLNAGVGPWYWNRNNGPIPLAKGQQDYLLFAEDFGYIEKCTVADDQGRVWELKDVHNSSALSVSTEQQRPNAISLEGGAVGLTAGGTIDTSASAGSPVTQAATSITIQSIAGEGLFLMTQPQGISTVAGAPGNGWLNGSFPADMFTKVSSGTETVVQTLSPNALWASIAVSFRMQTPGTAPVYVQSHTASGSLASSPQALTFTNPTTVGNGILVYVQCFNVIEAPWTEFSATDDHNNDYFLVALNAQGGAGGCVAALLWAPDVAQGTSVVTVTYNGTGSGSIGIIEISGVTGPLVNSPLVRFQGVPDQAYTANVIYQKRPIGFGPFFITSAATVVDGTTTYEGSFDPQAFPVGATANISGFLTLANNGSFIVVACNASALILENAGGVAETDPAYATNFTWAPVPDSFSDVYNNLFLSEAMAMVDDARAQLYRARGVAAFISKAHGLNDMQKNAFVQQWLARSQESATSALRVQQGVGARGQ
jgi:hypothetical protein